MSDTPGPLNDGTFIDEKAMPDQVGAENPAVQMRWEPDGTGN